MKRHASRSQLAALSLTAALNPLNSTMIAVALPAIATFFDVAPGIATTSLVTSYLIINIVAVSPAGRVADLIGHRRSLQLGQGLFALGALIGGMSPRLEGVVTGRLVMAIGGAIVIPTVMAMMRVSVPVGRRMRVFASLGAVMSLSAAIGPLLGGVLTARAGWQAIFLVNAPVLTFAWLLSRKTPAGPESSIRSSLSNFDGAGAILLTTALGALALGLKLSAWLLPIGILALVAFIRRERRSTDPIIDLELFRNSHFVASGLIIALQNLCMYALIFQLPFLLEQQRNLGPRATGPILLTLTASMALSAPLGGRSSERFGIRNTALYGLGLGSGALVLTRLALTSPGWAPLTVSLAIFGVSLGLLMGPAQSTALSAVPVARSAVASGVLATLRYFGGIIGISVISVFLDVDRSANAALAGHRACLWIYVGANTIALALACWLPRRLEAESAQPSIN